MTEIKEVAMQYETIYLDTKNSGIKRQFFVYT